MPPAVAARMPCEVGGAGTLGEHPLRRHGERVPLGGLAASEVSVSAVVKRRPEFRIPGFPVSLVLEASPHAEAEGSPRQLHLVLVERDVVASAHIGQISGNDRELHGDTIREQPDPSGQ